MPYPKREGELSGGIVRGRIVLHSSLSLSGEVIVLVLRLFLFFIEIALKQNSLTVLKN